MDQGMELRGRPYAIIGDTCRRPTLILFPHSDPWLTTPPYPPYVRRVSRSEPLTVALRQPLQSYLFFPCALTPAATGYIYC